MKIGDVAKLTHGISWGSTGSDRKKAGSVCRVAGVNKEARFFVVRFSRYGPGYIVYPGDIEPATIVEQIGFMEEFGE